MSTINAGLLDQHKYKNRTVSSDRFDKQDEDHQILDGTELFITLQDNQKLKRSDSENIDS